MSNTKNTTMGHNKNSIRKIAFCLIVIFFGSNIYSQEKITITGNVTEKMNGEGVPGITIIEKGTNNGTISDLDGNYSINVSDQSVYLIFSFIGMTTQEIAVGSQTVINVAIASTSLVTATGLSSHASAFGSVNVY